MGLAVAAVDVFGVQQLMRQMAVRLAQELRVELLDIRVFVGLADRLGFILGIQPRRARRARRQAQRQDQQQRGQAMTSTNA